MSSFPSKGKPKGEPEVSKDEVPVTESGVGDAFEVIFGEKGEVVNQDTVSLQKNHVRKDDESDDDILEEQPAKPKYSGT
ncbi:hypothetical protein, partial [Salmonella sp. s54925]|uniref:hypothetical protein n=1 Tax=Salmonella sp. s54925 TaxID=3159674 RepID=UPI003980DD95